MFWSSNGIWTAFVDQGTVRATCPGMPKGIVGAGIVEGIAAAVDTVARAILEIGSVECKWRRGALEDGPLAVVPSGQSWWFLVKVDSEPRLKRWSPKLGSQLERRLPASLQGSPLEWVFLGSSRQGPVVGTMAWPFSWVVLDSLGNDGEGPSMKGSLAGAEQLAMRSMDGSVPDWIGLPPLELDVGFIQTLVKVGGTERLFRLIDENGSLVRTKAHQGLIGLFASHQPSRRLAGLVGSTQQVAVFEWRWGR